MIYVSLSADGSTALISPDGFDPNNPLGHANTITFSAVYDTGTSGIVLSKETADSFSSLKQKVGSTDVVYSDVAVGGSTDFNVSQSLYVNLARNTPGVDAENTVSYTQQFGQLNTQIAINDASEAAFPADIIGTPAMAGKVVVLDSKAMKRSLNQLLTIDPNSNLDDLALRTYVYNPGEPYVGGDSNPGIPTANYHIQLSTPNFGRFTTVSPAGAQMST